MTNQLNSPETKAGGVEVATAFEDFQRGFEAYKEANDGKLAELARKSAVDPLSEDKVARIDRALDETKKRLDDMLLKNLRPALGQAPETRLDPATREHKAAFDAYMRTGEADGLKALERKALSVGSGPDGGYVAPPSVENEIMMRLAAISPIRGIAGVRASSAATYKKAFATTGFSAGWVAETAARPQTNTPVLAELVFPAMELYAMPAATQALLDDAIVDIDRWVAEEVETAFAEQEGQAFVTGDGISKPKGFLAYTNVANASWTWGNVGYIATGVAGAFPAANPSDILVDLIYAAKAGFRQNGSFVLNRKTQSTIRKFKDSAGNYLWQPPATAGLRATLMSFPVVEAEDMPDVAASSYSVAFGDFRRGYLVVDRVGVRILRDPYSSKPHVLFYTTKRVGGGIQDFDAIKLLKFAVS